MPSKFARYLAITHGGFYVVTGVWPVLSIQTFQAVTGRKSELWLVKTVGLLLGVIGGVLMLAGLRKRIDVEIPMLAVGSTVSLASIDIVYWKRGRLLPIYLIDAICEVALSVCWLAIMLPAKRRGTA